MALWMCAGAGDPNVDPEAAKKAKEIQKEAEKDEVADAAVIKLLLLGAGESGKSTIFKQMKIINQSGYSEEERRGFIAIVHSNTISSMKALLSAMDKIGIDHSSIDADIATFNEQSAGEKLTPELGDLIGKLWKDSVVQSCYERKSEFQLNDSANYYFDAIDRIKAGDYMPTEQDVLRSRVRTTGIVQSDFVIKGANFSMFDVGGQRNERRKWIHTFDHVNAVVFVAAMSEYDQVLFEDETQNRMEEALELFAQIVNSKWFKETSMILFLNKRDLFEMKLAKAPFTKYFPDAGGDDYDTCAEYLKKKFLARNKNKDKKIYSHCTCATDTGNVAFVFDSVVSIILEDNMKNSGLG